MKLLPMATALAAGAAVLALALPASATTGHRVTNNQAVPLSLTSPAAHPFPGELVTAATAGRQQFLPDGGVFFFGPSSTRSGFGTRFQLLINGVRSGECLSAPVSATWLTFRPCRWVPSQVFIAHPGSGFYKVWATVYGVRFQSAGAGHPVVLRHGLPTSPAPRQVWKIS